MEIFVLDRNKGDHFPVVKKKINSGSFKNVIYKMCLENIFNIFVLKAFGIK